MTMLTLHNRRLTIPCILVAVAALLTTGCSEPGSGLHDTQAFSESLPSKWLALDSTVADAVERDWIPGAVLLIAEGGEIKLHKAFGMADPIEGRPMQEDALFRICSQTKAITATAAMILWERGQLDLDAPVSDYLPSFSGIGILDSLHADTTFTTVPSKTPLTVRHLMTHTAGIPYGEIGDPRFERIYAHKDIVDLFPRDGRSTRDNADRLGTGCLAHEPGSQWTYGLGLDILVAVIEVASGEPYAPFLQRELLDPLGMVDTRFTITPEQAGRLTRVVEPAVGMDDADGPWRQHVHPRYSTDYPLHAEWPLCGGGAGLTSTARDYARFLQMYLDRGEAPSGRILREATIDSIMADQAPGLVGPGWYQGLVFGVMDEADTPGAFFWSGYFNTTAFGHPGNGTVVILLKQTYGTREDPTSGAAQALMAS